MNARFLHTVINSLAISGLLLLSACSSSESGDATGGRSSTMSPKLTLSLTDAVVDSAQQVWVEFTGITLKPADSDTIYFALNPARKINLLSLQGTASTDLFKNEPLPPGKYNWIRLHVNATNDNVLDSYIMLLDGSEHEIWIPSGSQTGLKINTSFELVHNHDLHLVIDFDLRKSVVKSGSHYKLKPTLRLVNRHLSGSVTGAVDPSFLLGAHCSDDLQDTYNAVYLFEGHDVTPDDMDNNAPEPVTSAPVVLNPVNGQYEFVIGFVENGNYTLSFTCQSDLDDPEKKDNIIFPVSENIIVEADAVEPPSPPPPAR